MPRKSDVNALQSCASTSAQNRSGEDEETGVCCNEVFIKEEPDEDDEVEFIMEKDNFKEEDCSYPGVCNEIQESKEEEEEQKYVADTIGNEEKKEFEAVVTEVFLPSIKEELEEDFEPAGRDPLEDSPIHTTEDDVPESEETVTSQECRRIPMNILKLDEAVNPCENWKQDESCAEFETDDKLELEPKGDILRKALLLSNIDSANSVTSYSPTSNNDGIQETMSRNINSNVLDCNKVKGVHGSVGYVITNSAPVSLVLNEFAYGMNDVQGVCTNINNVDVRENVTNLFASGNNSVSLVFQNCGPVFGNNNSLINPVGVQYCAVQYDSVLGQNVTVARKDDGDEEEVNLNRVYECRICKKRFNRTSNLKVHEKLHSGDRPFKCKWCGMAFTQSESLKAHDRLHTGETAYKCFLCAKEFFRSDHLKIHMMKHTAIKPHECEVCGKGFFKSNDLKRHLLTHSKQKSFRCNVCEKQFTLCGDLKRHMLTHTGVRSYVCEVCQKSFIQVGHLKSHLKSQHKEVTLSVR